MSFVKNNYQKDNNPEFPIFENNENKPDNINNDFLLDNNGLNLSTLLDNINKNNLTDYYNQDNSIFKKKIDKLNFKFYLETEKYLNNKNKNDIMKCQDRLFIILFKQINLYTEEIEKLNKIIQKYKENGTENDKINSEKNITNYLNLRKSYVELERIYNEKIINEEKIKQENDSLKRQIKFYKEKLQIELNAKSNELNLYTLTKSRLSMPFRKNDDLNISKILNSNNNSKEKNNIPITKNIFSNIYRKNNNVKNSQSSINYDENSIMSKHIKTNSKSPENYNKEISINNINSEENLYLNNILNNKKNNSSNNHTNFSHLINFNNQINPEDDLEKVYQVTEGNLTEDKLREINENNEEEPNGESIVNKKRNFSDNNPEIKTKNEICNKLGKNEIIISKKDIRREFIKSTNISGNNNTLRTQNKNSTSLIPKPQQGILNKNSIKNLRNSNIHSPKAPNIKNDSGKNLTNPFTVQKIIKAIKDKNNINNIYNQKEKDMKKDSKETINYTRPINLDFSNLSITSRQEVKDLQDLIINCQNFYDEEYNEINDLEFILKDLKSKIEFNHVKKFDSYETEKELLLSDPDEGYKSTNSYVSENLNHNRNFYSGKIESQIKSEKNIKFPMLTSVTIDLNGNSNNLGSLNGNYLHTNNSENVNNKLLNNKKPQNIISYNYYKNKK